jgi:hypothetical protein
VSEPVAETAPSPAPEAPQAEAVATTEQPLAAGSEAPQAEVPPSEPPPATNVEPPAEPAAAAVESPS